MRNLTLALGLLVAAAPLAAQETRFTKEMSTGSRLVIENINGEVRATQGTGRTAEIIVTKTVKRGDGDLVKAVMEESGGEVRVCTIYLNRNPNRTGCKDNGHNDDNWRGKDRLEVTMQYEVRVPAGVRLNVETVNGGIVITGVESEVRAETVNGSLEFDGANATSLSTVNGQVRATFSRANWEGTLNVETVNGGVDLTFPANFAAEISGETVNGGVTTAFPITIEGKWGPKSFRGTIGSGGGRSLKIETVNGGITLRKR
ncbi:MAG: hypothetical protein V4558_14355 [Gemmatimonadota bacterium]